MGELRFENLGAGDYERAKSVLNKARHPGFVGRELFYRCATMGVVCVAVLDDADVGVAMVVKEKLQALSVVTAAQGAGVGAQLMTRLRPRWVSAIGEKVEWFRKRGYKEVGPPKVGQNGAKLVQLMERGEGETPADQQPQTVTSLVVPKNETNDARGLLPMDKMVRHAMRMLIDKTWVVGHSHYAVAKEWECTPARAYDAYREALRFIRIARDSEANRTQILIRAREIADQDEPDRLNALTLLAKMTGSLEPPKDGEPRTSEERVAYLRECLRDPDDELLEALLAEREAVMNALAVPAEGERSE